jgi:HK97 family phage prohead protease
MISKDRQYRAFDIQADGGGHIEGYAAVFEQPTVLYESDGVQYKEVISRGAFDNAEMDDVVLNVGHQGKPAARTKNGSLELGVDDYGLNFRADLTRTSYGRSVKEDVDAGLLDKASFAFTVADEVYDRAAHTRRINAIKRVYDCALVDFPAYEGTYVMARSYFEAEAERERAEARHALELAKAKYDFLGAS